MFVVYEDNLVLQFVEIQAYRVHRVNVVHQVSDVMVNEAQLVCLDQGVEWGHLVCKDLLVLLVYVILVNVNQDSRLT